MKNKASVIAIILAVVVLAWGLTFYKEQKKAERLIEIKQEIQANEELGVYKKVINLYEELITIDKKNIKWYNQLADAYYNIEEYGNFQKSCEVIISKFPNDISGYLKLAQFYQKDNSHDKIIELYKRLPQNLKEDKDFNEIYKKSQYQFNYLARAYDEILQFGSDYAAVKTQNLYGYVDKSTSEAVKVKFHIARPYIEDKAAVYDGEQWYFIDKDGDKILATKEKVEDLFSFSEGYAVAKIGGKYGFVDANFKKVHMEYDYATNFLNGIAAVKMDDKWAIINNKFKKITDYAYDDVLFDEFNICSRSGVIFAEKDGKYQMLNLTGKNITKDDYESARVFSSKEPTAVKKDGKWGFVDIKGKKIIDYKYEDAGPFNLGLAPVRIDGKWGFINLKNELVISNDFDGAEPFNSTGVTSVKIGNIYRFIQLIKYR